MGVPGFKNGSQFIMDGELGKLGCKKPLEFLATDFCQGLPNEREKKGIRPPTAQEQKNNSPVPKGHGGEQIDRRLHATSAISKDLQLTGWSNADVGVDGLG
jgi:hypothetical protein